MYPDGETAENPYADLSKEDLTTQLLIKMMNNNPLIWDGLIISDDEVLLQYFKLLTKAEEVQIDADAFAQSCVS